MINSLFKLNSISLHILHSKPLGNHTLKNNEKNTWKFTLKTWKNHGNIMEFCQSEKVGTLVLPIEAFNIILLKIMEALITADIR